MAAMVYLLFIVCILPSTVLAPVLRYSPLPEATVTTVTDYCVVLFTANSAINPFIYALMNDRLKLAYTLLLRHPPWQWGAIRHDLEKLANSSKITSEPLA